MATIPAFSYPLSEESAVHHLINLHLPDSADLFELADTCAAYVSVLVETDDAVTFATSADDCWPCSNGCGSAVTPSFRRIGLNS